MAERIESDRVSAMPSLVPSGVPVLSDDECVTRLARAIETRDPKCLQEVAELIGRLAVTVE
jgi:predicted transcriptional regulator